MCALDAYVLDRMVPSVSIITWQWAREPVVHAVTTVVSLYRHLDWTRLSVRGLRNV